MKLWHLLSFGFLWICINKIFPILLYLAMRWQKCSPQRFLHKAQRFEWTLFLYIQPFFSISDRHYTTMFKIHPLFSCACTQRHRFPYSFETWFMIIWWRIQSRPPCKEPLRKHCMLTPGFEKCVTWDTYMDFENIKILSFYYVDDCSINSPFASCQYWWCNVCH